MKKEKAPSKPGAYRFVGYRTRSLRNDIQALDELMLVEKEEDSQGQPSLYVLRFGKPNKETTVRYQGTWYYIGDEIERITSDLDPESA